MMNTLRKYLGPSWFLNTKIWKSVIRLTPRLTGYPKFDLQNYFKIRQILRNDPDGIYCFVGCDNRSVAVLLQRIFYKFWWGHSGFIELDSDGEVYISHVRKKLRYDNLLYYLKEVDNFALLKLPLTDIEKQKVREKLDKIKKSKCFYKIRDPLYTEPQYTIEDYWQHHDTFYFYCSEYQYFICMNTMNQNWAVGRSRFTTDDLYQNSIVIFEE